MTLAKIRLLGYKWLFGSFCLLHSFWLNICNHNSVNRLRLHMSHDEVLKIWQDHRISALLIYVVTCDITISIWIPGENKLQETSFSRSYLRLWPGSLGFFPTYNSQFLMANHVRVLGLREQQLKLWHLLFVPGKPSRILKRTVFGFLWI